MRFLNSDSLFLADLSSVTCSGPGESMLSVSNMLDKEPRERREPGRVDVFCHVEEGGRVSLGYRVRL